MLKGTKYGLSGDRMHMFGKSKRTKIRERSRFGWKMALKTVQQ